MSENLSTGSATVDKRAASFWPGRAWLAFLLIGVVVLEYRTAPKDALDLGERGMLGNMALVAGLFLFLPATVGFCLWEGLRRLVRKDSARSEHWLRLVCVAIVAAGLFVGRRSYVLENPVLAEEEPVYLRIAAMARQELLKPDGGGYLGLDLDPRREKSQDARARELRGRFNVIVPDYWPRSLLQVRIDADCVVLERGSGRLGRVGVRIYDKKPVVFSSEAELRRNPYLPRQGCITDRFWFFTS